jgi:hypothetical protein
MKFKKNGRVGLKRGKIRGRVKSRIEGANQFD